MRSGYPLLPIIPTPEKPIRDRPRPWKPLIQGRFMLISTIAVMGLTSMLWGWHKLRGERSPIDPAWDVTPAPLVMQGGDPFIRALMRTISASEANSPRPYSILYGGEHVEDLGRHPDECIPIVAGPNVGDCTTAAGRYQFITTTWLEKAETYHPNPDGWLLWKSYSFEPEYQDEVVYAWLNDPQAWGVDLAQLLRNGELEKVLWHLSPTWTSLGYGIESNSMTDALPEIYQQMLDEEMQAAIGLSSMPSSN